MSKVLDQRDILGPFTLDGMRDHWIMFLRESRGGLTITPDARTITAYVSDGRWVADCPHCNDGIACWDENPQGCCLGCGHLYAVEFPAGYKEAEILLLDRPQRRTRNWFPHRGETVESLRVETMAHAAHESVAVIVREANRQGIPAADALRAVGMSETRAIGGGGSD